MIAQLTGTLVDHVATSGILDVNGVGYEVHATSTSLTHWSTQSIVTLRVSTQVREDAITLYAFDDSTQRATFLALMTVQGIGPKVSLAALDTLGTDGLAAAVSQDDVRKLSSIPGVGKKTAQRMALELKGKLKATFAPTAPTRTTPADPLPLALARLGYTKSEIDRAQTGLAGAGLPEDADVGARLREALKILSSR